MSHFPALAVFALLACSTLVACSEFETTDEEAPRFPARVAAFEAAADVVLPDTTAAPRSNDVADASHSDPDEDFVFEFVWDQRSHAWNGVDLTQKGGVATHMLALADAQASALAAGGFEPIRSAWYRPVERDDGDGPIVGARLALEETHGHTTTSSIGGYPVRIDGDLVHVRVYAAPATGASVTIRNHWVADPKSVESELMLIDQSAIGHDYVIGERSFAESLVFE